jgi:hypothetical protein
MPSFQKQDQKFVFCYVIKERRHDAKSDEETEAHATLERKTSVLTMGYFREPAEPSYVARLQCGPEKTLHIDFVGMRCFCVRLG